MVHIVSFSLRLICIAKTTRSLSMLFITLLRMYDLMYVVVPPLGLFVTIQFFSYKT